MFGKNCNCVQHVFGVCSACSEWCSNCLLRRSSCSSSDLYDLKRLSEQDIRQLMIECINELDDRDEARHAEDRARLAETKKQAEDRAEARHGQARRVEAEKQKQVRRRR